jgi:hypothetical protein
VALIIGKSLIVERGNNQDSELFLKSGKCNKVGFGLAMTKQDGDKVPIMSRK